MTALKQDEIGIDPKLYDNVNVWLRRGDGIAVYENLDLASRDVGERKFVSYGSFEAQLEVEEPPEVLPDIGSSINWRYRLVGTYRGDELK